MTISVIGTGFVGVVTAAIFAKHGHTVFGVDIDPKKVDQLNQGIVPFFEPGLEELLQSGRNAGNLKFTTSYEEAIKTSSVVFIAVGTPSSPEGKADTSYVFAAVESMAPLLADDMIVVIKSTVPPGIFTEIRQRITAKSGAKVHLASMPEFLREGTAVNDTQKPDRIVIGAEGDVSAGVLTELHKPFGAPIIVTSPTSAQLGKYAANSYLALRIGFINQIADLCEKVGADVQEVITIIGADKRIGTHYWYPGLGYGGSCYPKDVRELSYTTQQLGMGESLFVRLNELNNSRPEDVFIRWTQRVGGWQGKKVAVLGLSFKPNTNDTREAPSLWLVPKLIAAGATVVGYDPKANEVFSATVTLTPEQKQQLSLVDDVAGATAEADVVIALVEWPEITQHDFSSASFAVSENQSTTGSQRWFIDARNQFIPMTVVRWGFTYLGIGRQTVDKE